MALVPRSVDEILSALRQTRSDVDPYADSTKGPISVLLYCYALGLARVEQHAGYLSTVYQMENADELARDDLDNLGRNYGKNPDAGNPSRVVLTFWMQSRPQAGKLYNVDAGTLASTPDGRYIFATLRSVMMNGDSPDLYYNSDQQRYEISVTAEATATGDDYNLPEGTISAFIGSLQDFDGVVNKKPATNGSDPIGPTQFRNVIWNALQGLNANLAGNIIASIDRVDTSGYDDVSLVPSTDTQAFGRTKFLNGKLGYNVQLLTDTVEDDYYGGTAQGGETDIFLPKRPVSSIEYCTVDGKAVPFTFHADTSTIYAGSILSADKVMLYTPLLPAQVFEIHYYYYSLIYDSTQALRNYNSPFRTDILVYLGRPVPVFVAASISISGVQDTNSVVSDLRSATTAYLNNPAAPTLTRRRFISSLDPYDYQQTMLRTVNGLSNFTVLNFFRMDISVMDVETITFDGVSEYPVLSPTSYFG
jgi:hypothetical protein